MEKTKNNKGKDIHYMVEQLQKGETIICHKCGKGHYVSFAENVAYSNDFYCDHCGNVIRISPNILVE